MLSLYHNRVLGCSPNEVFAATGIQIHCSLRLYIEAAVALFGDTNGLLAKMTQIEKAGAKTLPPDIERQSVFPIRTS